MPFNPIDPKPNFPKLEEEVLKFWEENQIFKKSLEQNKEGQPFTFYDGPPFATGTPHYGHILASTIKDMIPRYQSMNGRFVRRRWGWDCHGLPIEELVERKLGISGKKDIEKMGIAKFNETCRSMVMEYVSEWRKTIRKIARWVDFDNSYKTMDRDFMESVWWGFKQIYDKGLVYEGRRVLLYCPRCETPISNFEVAMDNSYKDVTEETVTVKFKVKGQDKTYLLAWTTTPWTLPGNVALAVGSSLPYVKAKLGDEILILSKDRVDANFKQLPEIMEEVKGSDLLGLEYEPLFDVPAVNSDKTFKVYDADFVTTEDGTGIVHTAVVYGEEDYQLGLKVGLPIVPLLDEKGIFNEESPDLVRGQFFKDSERLIKKDLESRGLLFARQQHQHSYPHCWRCGTMLYYNAIPAWFMNIQKIKDGLIKTNEGINWYPEHLKHGRYQKSIEAAPDWNISRNRYWGNPIPIWKCESCEHVKVVGSIKELGLSRNTFYFTRHGEAENNVLGLAVSWPEPKPYHLTEKGRVRAKTMAENLKNLGGVDLIISSDMTRTYDTAVIAGDVLGVPVSTDERLREIDVGSANGKPITPDYMDNIAASQRWDHTTEGGESQESLTSRMVACIQDINLKHQGKRILIVSHGDPIWVLQKYFGSEREYPQFAHAFEMDVQMVDLHRPYIDEIILKCEKCGSNSKRVPEIFDSWVEAGSMPFAEYHYPFDNKQVFESRYPAQFVAEYIAQTRAWFYVMHVIGYNLFGKAPFENVVTTGNILAEDGSKMSKSKNNYPDPWNVMEKFGVDALRFYLMSSVVMQADNSLFSEKDLGIVFRKNILILWNVFNYFVTYANEAGWDTGPASLDYQPKNVLDRWALARTQKLVNQVTENMDKYNTVVATRSIEAYIDDLSTWYLRRSRGRKDSEFFDVLRHCLLMCSRIMAPVTPYLSEIIFKNLTRRDILSVHLTKWPEVRILSPDEEQSLSNIEHVRTVVSIGHMRRQDAKMKLRQPLARAYYSGSRLSKEYEDILADELNVKQVEFKEGLEQNGVELDVQLTAELVREGLSRELERVVQDMRKRSGLKVGETVNLFYDTNDEELIAAMGLIDRNKTFVKEIFKEKTEAPESVIVEGKQVALGLTRT